jgi:hypothetical protein
MVAVGTVTVPVKVVISYTPATEKEAIFDNVLALVFDEWLRQWQADPDAFSAIEEEFTATQAPGRNDTYGASCARTFRRLQRELISARFEDEGYEVIHDEC